MLEWFDSRAESCGTQGDLMRVQQEYAAWSESLHRDKGRAMPKYDLDRGETLVPRLAAATAQGARTAERLLAALAGDDVDRVLIADPTLDNDALVAAMIHSMRTF